MNGANFSGEQIDNAIIPIKERIADVSYDPVRWIFRKIFGSSYK